MPAFLSNPAEVPGQIRRTIMPVQVTRALDVSKKGPSFHSPVAVINKIRSLPEIMSLLDEANVHTGHGPARAPGNWALAFVAFTLSQHADIQPWHASHGDDDRLWNACGFVCPPAYQTVWQRFAELEEFAGVFDTVVALLVQSARKLDDRIGMWIWVDSTEASSYSDAKHACRPEDDCPFHGQARQPRLRKLSAEDAAERRHKEDAIEEKPAQATSTTPSRPGLRPIPPEGTTERDDTGIRYVANRHWRRSNDPDARTRMYSDRDCWHGYYHGRAVDMMTGAALAVRVTPANVNESVSFRDLYGAAKEVVGAAPVAVCADRGYAFDGVHEMLLADAATPVIPYRMRHGHSPRRAEETTFVDRHGIPKCQFCFRPGNQVRFSGKGTPRVWFTCSGGTTPDCTKEQVMDCRKAKRRLLPIPRTSIIYGVLRDMHQAFERTHHMFRTRFSSGMKSTTKRPRRVGLGWQQLRASAGAMIQWLWVLMNLKWLDGQSTTSSAVGRDSSRYHDTVIDARRRHLIPGGGSPRVRKWRGPQFGAAPPTSP
jgi:hypothetical protein